MDAYAIDDTCNISDHDCFCYTHKVFHKARSLPKMTSMDMREFQALNEARCKRWHPLEKWDLNAWLVATGGELGEAMNIAKKMNRLRDKIVTTDDRDMYRLREDLIAELADVYIYLDLIFSYLEVDKARAVGLKFNRTSKEYGFPERAKVTDDDGREMEER